MKEIMPGSAKGKIVMLGRTVALKLFTLGLLFLLFIPRAGLSDDECGENGFAGECPPVTEIESSEKDEEPLEKKELLTEEEKEQFFSWEEEEPVLDEKTNFKSVIKGEVPFEIEEGEFAGFIILKRACNYVLLPLSSVMLVLTYGCATLNF